MFERNKTAPLNMRIHPDFKARIETAARKVGATVTGFIEAAARDRCNEILGADDAEDATAS